MLALPLTARRGKILLSLICTSNLRKQKEQVVGVESRLLGERALCRMPHCSRGTSRGTGCDRCRSVLPFPPMRVWKACGCCVVAVPLLLARAFRHALGPQSGLPSPLWHCVVDCHIHRRLDGKTILRVLLGPEASRLARPMKRLRCF